MKSKEYLDDKLAKKIRKILLLNADKEMKKIKKNNHFILINSMNPTQLENKFLQLKEGPTHTPTSHFTYICQNHLVKRVVDNNRKINYFYSDNLGLKQGFFNLNKNPKKFFTRFSAQTLRMDIIMLLHGEEQKNQLNNPEAYDDYIPLYSCRLHKINIFEEKKVNGTSTNNKKTKNICSNEDIHNKQTINKYSQGKEKYEKIKANIYLRNFCFTMLKKNMTRNFLNENQETCTNIEIVDIIEKEKNKEEFLSEKIEKKKRKKIVSSKMRTKKIIKESKEPKVYEPKKFSKHKSTKNNVFRFSNKLKINNDNSSKLVKFSKGDSNSKSNRKIIKLNTEVDIEKKNEDINFFNKKKKSSKFKDVRKMSSRKSIEKLNSNYLFISSDRSNKYRNENKFQKSHKIVLDVWN